MRSVAFVTGGTRGIGRAVCLKLAEDGFDIRFTYRTDPVAAEALVQELHARGADARGIQVDMADATALVAALEKITVESPGIEVFVSNAGVSKDGLALRYSQADWDVTMNTNLRAAFLCAQALLRPMMKARKGSMVFISSVIGQTGNGGQVAYSASKGAINAMVKSLAKEVGSRNIRVNAIAPGFIKTDMTEALPTATKEAILAQIPLGTFGDPADVAETVAFLASPRSRYITGQVLGVNGGMYM